MFLAATGEEVGLVGTRWYIRHLAWPLARTVGNLELEMIGRPDPLAGGAGRAWLTGYERSTLGDELRAAGVPLVADPRPAQHFFERSDNIAYAWLGIPAHTLSSFNLHRDYHQPSDEADRIDAAHMAAVVDATVRAVRLMADGPRPAWKPGQQPQAAAAGAPRGAQGARARTVSAPAVPPTPPAAARLFPVIDAMPMRRREVARQRAQKPAP